jgi:hypothetical protein
MRLFSVLWLLFIEYTENIELSNFPYKRRVRDCHILVKNINVLFASIEVDKLWF